MKNAKKVLMLLTNAFISDPRVINEARALVAAGYGVTLFVWDRGEEAREEEKKDGIDIRRFFVRSKHGAGLGQIMPLMTVWLKWFFAGLKKEFDVVHCHDFDTLPVGQMLAKLKGKKIIFDSHEIYSGMMEGHLPRACVKFIKFLEKIFVNKVDAVIVPSKLYKEYYSITPAKYVMVGNWKNPKDYNIKEEKKNKIKQELNIPGNALVISYISNLGKERVIQPLLDAVSNIGNKIFLIIAGKGAQEDMVKGYQCENIKYLGFIDDQQRIANLTAISDVIYYGIDTTTHSGKTNCPNKLFEAMAAGKAFLSVNVGEAGEFINGYGIGIGMKKQTAEEIKNILTFLHQNPEECKKIGEKGLKLAQEQYNWNNSEKNLLELYERLS